MTPPLDPRVPGTTKALPQTLRLLLGVAGRIGRGSVEIRVPDGRVYRIAGREPGPSADMTIHRPRMVARLIFGGSVGFGASYMDGDWETSDLAALLTLASMNASAFPDMHMGSRAVTAMRRVWHRLHDNTRGGSRRNIAHHYDLGNAFYARWLDPSMTYSSAVFEREAQDLRAAQETKYRKLAEKLVLGPDQRVLEIGCGWGGFAEIAAKEYGARVTAITVSREQLDFARQRIQAAGLNERVEARFVDYRDVQDRFDKIASIEMFEAVGERHWPTYFGKVRECLEPGGRAALQIITIADRWFDSYRRGVDFIQRYIFPGGMLPSMSALTAQCERAGLAVDKADFYGQHYARTLAEWNHRFQAAWHELEPMGFDRRFKRMWEFYLAYCEAGFRTEAIDVVQAALVRR
jgi:cyclopropane-fatty-acyl-phospholipid synthase